MFRDNAVLTQEQKETFVVLEVVESDVSNSESDLESVKNSSEGGISTTVN
ncbi:hypothetical protein bcCo53_001275 (plasmid) [Borrelia coriaceae]|nr:hypothetical protein [Borrelia coriaceae]UPA17106.1 hypothetical protein bcCo53_001275 [Borrelia coriaceae]